MQRRRTRWERFTLIELLVVIVIIAILVAMLMPALNRAKFSAKSLVCTKNLQTWGFTHHTYAGDNDEQYNQATGVPSNPNSHRLAFYTTFNEEYNLPTDLFFCPMKKEEYRTYAWATGYGAGTFWLGYHYWVPRASSVGGPLYPWYSAGPPWYGPRRIGDPVAADDVLMSCSLLIWTANLETYYSDQWGPGHKYRGVLDNYNVLHEDGHVDRKRSGEESKQYDSTNASNWY